MVVVQAVLAFIVTLGILVIIHEYGHYLVARWSGVRILRFAVGFGRPIWSYTDRRGTEFAVAAIPLGGYLRMYDERDPVPAGAPDLAVGVPANQLSPWWRIAIAFGGPVANFLLAIVVFWFLFVAGTTEVLPVLGTVEEDTPAWQAGLRGGEEVLAVDGVTTQGWNDIGMQLIDRLGETGNIELRTRAPGAAASTGTTANLAINAWHHGVNEPDVFGSLGLRPVRPAVVGEVLPDTPAERAGLRANDLVVAAAGVAVGNWQDWVAAIEASPGAPLELTIKRRGNLRSLTLTPGSRTTDDGAEVGFAGVMSATRTVRYGVVAALPLAVNEMASKTVSILGTLGKMLTGAVSTRNLSGPITIAQVAGDTVDQGWRRYVGLLALLSLSLAVLNLLPIPLLDGGQIVMFVAEVVRGRPLSDRTQVIAFQVGLFVVGGLMVLALSNDITRLLGTL